jgi:hypothetical protein
VSDKNEKLPVGDAPDFEGHKLTDDQKLEQKLERADDTGEPDFEGHQLGGPDQRLEKIADKLEG